MANGLVHFQGQVCSIVDDRSLEFRKDEATEDLSPIERNPEFPDFLDRDRFETKLLDSVGERRVGDRLPGVLGIVHQVGENRGRVEKLGRQRIADEKFEVARHPAKVGLGVLLQLHFKRLWKL